MERKNNPNAILWHKTGGGSLHITINKKVKIVKPGEKFYAEPHEIPEAFRDVIIPIDSKGQRVSVEVATEQEKVEEAEAKVVYNLKHRGGGWWDVVNEEGKAINETALKKDKAEELLNSLS